MNTKVTVIEINHCQQKNILINNLKKSDTWKIQLTIANNFISSTDNDDERVMHSKSDNIKIIINNESDEVMKELFDSLDYRYRVICNQWKVVTLSSIIFIYWIINVINPNCGRWLHIDSPKWIKNKKTAINPINKKDDKCFQYAVTVALNHKENKGIRFQNLEGIHFPSEKEDWKKLEKNNVKVALNILYAKTKNISCLCFEA